MGTSRRCQKGDPHFRAVGRCTALHSAVQFPTARQRGSKNQELLMSAGFVNRIMRNMRFTERMTEPSFNEDDVIVSTNGHVTFRMWDVQTCAPEVVHKEAFHRLFGCKRKAPETTIDWDFLLKD